MKKLYIYLLLILCAISVNAQNLNSEQLIQVVKNFENNQNLTNLKVNLTDQQVSYKTNNDYKEWDISNNEVDLYINYRLGDMSDCLLESNSQYSLLQCKNIAINYINSKNVSLIGFDQNQFMEWKRGCYIFTFIKFIDRELNLLSNNRIIISIDGLTGQIANYAINRVPEYNIINRPSLTNEQIFNIIQDYFGEIPQTSLQISNYIINETNNSIFKAVMVGNLGEAVIDAYTHEIVEFNSFGGGNVNLLKPIKPIKKNSKNKNIELKSIEELINSDISNIYVSNPMINLVLCDTENSKDVKYTVIPTGFEIDKEDKGIARMEVNGKKFIFRNGSYWCFINNKTYNIGGNCIIKDGILQLPEDFYKKVQTKDYVFFPKSQNSITK